jgi:hypothetical protein
VTQDGVAVACLDSTINELASTSAGFTAVELSWFAVQTYARCEKKVTAELQEKGIQTFLPLIRAKHQRSDRQRFVEEPMFRV